MLNFRKVKQDFSSNILKQGRALYDNDAVAAARIVFVKPDSIRFSGRVKGNFDNYYDGEVEIDRHESEMVDSNCDCPYNYDCQHLAALLFYLEEHFEELWSEYHAEAKAASPVAAKGKKKAGDEAVETLKPLCVGVKQQRELLQEYSGACRALGQWPFFLPEEQLSPDHAEVAVILCNTTQKLFDQSQNPEIQLALRLPLRSKPLNILNLKEFLEAVHHKEPVTLSGKRFFFTLDSFPEDSRLVLKTIMDHARFVEPKGEKNLRVAQVGSEIFGNLLAELFDMATNKTTRSYLSDDEESLEIPCFYCETLEEPLKYGNQNASFRFDIEYLESPAPKILLDPHLVTGEGDVLNIEQASILECSRPGMIVKNVYYRFSPPIKRKHLKHLLQLRDLTIPQPLFGTFVENAIPQMMQLGSIGNKSSIDKFVTLPFAGQVEAVCDISYLNGELEAQLHFNYDKAKVGVAGTPVVMEQIAPFVTFEGVLARNLAEEHNIINDLFQDFLFDEQTGTFSAKTDKKIVEFMTTVIPHNNNRVKFHCPENLLDQFVYDDSKFKLSLRECKDIDQYEVELVVEGQLMNTKLDQLWDCISAKRAFIELPSQKVSERKKGKTSTNTKVNKILVLNLERLTPLVQIFDEIGIGQLDNHTEKRPLWSLANISAKIFEGLPVEFSMTPKLYDIQQQMLGLKPVLASAMPKNIQATLREYQKEGIYWLGRLRQMHLSGILADDMGLGKTIQAIVALTQEKTINPKSISIVVCPTSLIYNWKQEFHKFNPDFRVLSVDGTPVQRKKLLQGVKDYDIVVTSYSLLQKDIEIYQDFQFSYAILDEAQHIKNRSTRNARSVKMLKAKHRLILTGTPIENSLEELWSLFDFLMPGLLSSYDRFTEKYLRATQSDSGQRNLEPLRQKVSPFILRRMKKDVLSELPPVNDIVYHCHLSETQQDLYRSYAESARNELSKLVKKEGFDRVQIHVLATLTRLKQICCHPAIFAKEEIEAGDSAKYDMLMELLRTLIEGKHKTVIFSQYTQMLQIIKRDLEKMGLRFAYLDGSSKNRLNIVNKFNEDETIPLFLVSLKAGGSGLNLTGADTVIHYDMWWNPAVETQATDRVHRIGQKNKVSSYKLVTLNTIEEKIVELQNRKRGLMQEVVSGDEEALAKLSWEEVLELLQT